MGKSIHQIITLNIQGSEKAVVGTGEMLESVVEALQSQFPRLKIEAISHVGSVIEKPFLMLPTKLQKIVQANDPDEQKS